MLHTRHSSNGLDCLYRAEDNQLTFPRRGLPALSGTPVSAEFLGGGVSACNGRNTPSHASPSFPKRLLSCGKLFKSSLDDLNPFHHGVAETPLGSTRRGSTLPSRSAGRGGDCHYISLGEPRPVPDGL